MQARDVRLDDSRFRMRRFDMVEHQLRDRQVRDERVLEAMTAVPRHLFVPAEQQDQAYEDHALPIGSGQTISQPYMVACALETLGLIGEERVLEVGTGSGYQAALLGLLAREVYSVEIVPWLASHAREILEQLGFDNVKVALANGSIGLVQAAPYDAIVVSAGAPEVPTALLEQLGEGGTMVIPVGETTSQQLLRINKQGGRVTTDAVAFCSFVPLLGQHGWNHH